MVFEKITNSILTFVTYAVLVQYAVYMFFMTIPKDKHYDEIAQAKSKIAVLWKKKARIGALITEYFDSDEFQKIWANLAAPVDPK